MVLRRLGDVACSRVMGSGEASRRQNVGSYSISERTGPSDRARVQSHAPMGSQSGAPVGAFGWFGGGPSVEATAQALRSPVRLELGQRVDLDLADALAGEAELLADLLADARLAPFEYEKQLDAPAAPSAGSQGGPQSGQPRRRCAAGSALSLASVLTSIWRMRSRVRPNSLPTLSRVRVWRSLRRGRSTMSRRRLRLVRRRALSRGHRVGAAQPGTP